MNSLREGKPTTVLQPVVTALIRNPVVSSFYVLCCFTLCSLACNIDIIREGNINNVQILFRGSLTYKNFPIIILFVSEIFHNR